MLLHISNRCRVNVLDLLIDFCTKDTFLSTAVHSESPCQDKMNWAEAPCVSEEHLPSKSGLFPQGWATLLEWSCTSRQHWATSPQRKTKTRSGTTPTGGPSTLAACPSSWLRWWACSPSTSTLRRTRSCAAARALTSSKALLTPCYGCPATVSGGGHDPAHAPLTPRSHRKPRPLASLRPSACLPPPHLSLWPLCQTRTAAVEVVEVAISPCTPYPGTLNWAAWEAAHHLSTGRWTAPPSTSSTTISQKIPAAAVVEEEQW